ncbi:NAD-dependent epimerase [Alloalcanivorax xenomutans]|uniref:NAD-dependent epimerase n=1 Tax=Alloalcanivorax xenomutans TaxID=1094342 RepID=UPI0009B67027|nr:NAD-dependent epimerase [Alloalcanivorax xenomutans]
MKVLITGMAGFIGHATAKRLAGRGDDIIGVDNLNEYYDIALKKARLEDLKNYSNIEFFQFDISDRNKIDALFSEFNFDRVVHLAAQAGVRYSLDNPSAYVESNLVGYLNILEGCRHHEVPHFVYASSSSVYGMNAKVPFSTKDAVDHPVSLYAATKKANELMAHSYSHLYSIPTTGLRFFTVYGPWGRPDMAPFKFAKAMLEGNSISVFNHGDMQRDFTYIDDIVEGVVRILDIIPAKGGAPNSPDSSNAPFSIYNIGNGSPVDLMEFIKAIELATNRKSVCDFLPMQPGDVPRTWADTEALFEATGYRPQTGIEEGVARFVEWYRKFYKI